MTVWKLYRYEDDVIAPTMVVTDEGVFVETQPVQLVSINSRQDLLDLIEDVLNSSAGKAQEEDLNNPDLPDSTQPVLLEVLQIKRWKDFEKRAIMYTLHRHGELLTMHVTGRGSDGMWTVDDSRSRSYQFNSESFSDICSQIADELISRRPVESPKALGLAMLPAPRDSD